LRAPVEDKLAGRSGSEGAAAVEDALAEVEAVGAGAEVAGRGATEGLLAGEGPVDMLGRAAGNVDGVSPEAAPAATTLAPLRSHGFGGETCDIERRVWMERKRELSV